MMRHLSGVLFAIAVSGSSGADRITSLDPCPGSPNCVSSLATDNKHFIEPLRFEDAPQAALARLRSVLHDTDRMEIVSESGPYLHVEATSRVFRFVDDVEFLLIPEARLIHVRSASRTGYSDFGVNRRRVERIRAAMQSME